MHVFIIFKNIKNKMLKNVFNEYYLPPATQQAEEDPDDPDDPAEDVILDPVVSAPSSRATSPVPSTSRDTSPVPASSRVASPSKMDPSPARSTTFSGFDDDIDVCKYFLF
ncbi:unnamed protein product [Meganyctiphanes norvegica]|uniref:Uncharacterized protein n=1 Tax=Meganyctiphanes norvegica TaxID=48144 RepID=A0AAV2QXB9_MEGNR